MPQSLARPPELIDLVRDIGISIKNIDSRRPRAAPYQAGIGPHKESDVVALLAQEFAVINPERYADRVALNVRYPNAKRQTCDLCLAGVWAVEFKQFRMLGDNGKSNDNMVTHILSPYEQDRSALTDCLKMANSDLPGRRAIVIYGYDYPMRPMDPVIEAFELLSGKLVNVGPRITASFSGLVHPVHSEGRVFGWEITARAS